MNKLTDEHETRIENAIYIRKTWNITTIAGCTYWEEFVSGGINMWSEDIKPILVEIRQAYPKYYIDKVEGYVDGDGSWVPGRPSSGVMELCLEFYLVPLHLPGELDTKARVLKVTD
jgi:hypothetical protein